MEYTTILADRAYDLERMTLFRRGPDLELLTPGAPMAPTVRKLVAARAKKVRNQFTMAYTGRISRDKNLDFLLQTQALLRTRGRDVRLYLAGDGPHRKALQKLYGNNPGIRFLGRLGNHEIPGLLAIADLFVFPRNTDTFGMSVLEAQACGVPCFVSDQGGPAELVNQGATGFIVPARDTEQWAMVIEETLRMKESNPQRFQEMRGADAAFRRIARRVRSLLRKSGPGKRGTGRAAQVLKRDRSTP